MISSLVILAILSGSLCGYFYVPENLLPTVQVWSTIMLNLVLLFVGIDIGGNKNIVKDMKKNGLKILVIPFGIVIGSIIGGVVSSFLCHMSLRPSVSVASGFGWYSLSAIMLTTLESSKVGTIAFLTNVFRELIGIVSVPYVAKHFNGYSTIAPAGASSMDSVLPIIAKETEPKVVVAACINGIVLSAMVPIIINFLYSF